MAVGATPGDAAMFGERWNGATWSVEPLPPGPDQTSLLSSAACPAVNLCYAVGYSDTLSDNTVATPLLVRADDITTLKTDQPAPKRRRRKSGARTSGHGVPYRP
jgi:hypothetical protein